LFVCLDDLAETPISKVLRCYCSNGTQWGSSIRVTQGTNQTQSNPAQNSANPKQRRYKRVPTQSSADTKECQPKAVSAPTTPQKKEKWFAKIFELK
jgi:hypothetical protein